MSQTSRANLVLIGGRRSGKSSVSRRIVRADKRFALLSLDTLIRYERDGATIANIVAAEGWAGFRELEWLVVQKASAFAGGLLIDAGGGVVTDVAKDGTPCFSERKVAALRQTGLIVYLQRDVEELVSKAETGDLQRPPLSDTAAFRDIMKQREPWYLKAADHVVPCTGRKKGAIAKDILNWFNGMQATSA